MKVFAQPRRRFVGAALLLLLFLSACGAPLAGESWAGMSTDGRYLYVAYQENIFRVKADGPDGLRPVEWLAKGPNNTHMYAPPAIAADHTLYAGAYDHHIYAFPQNVAQAAPIPVTDDAAAADRYIGGVLIHENVGYIGMGNKGLKAFDTTTNKELWTFPDTQYGVWSTPIFADGVVYFTSLDHFLYAIDAKAGTLKWKVDAGGAMAGSPLLDNGVLYVGTFSHEVVAISVSEQKVINRFKTEGWVWGAPVMLTGEGSDSSTMFFGDLAGWVYAIDPISFKEKWRRNDPANPGGIRGSLAIAKRDGKTLVIAGSENKLIRFYDAENKAEPRTSSRPALDQILSDLIVIGDDVIATTQNKTEIVFAVDIDSGVPSWHVDLDEQVKQLQTATGIPFATEQATDQATAPAASGTTASNGATPAATVQK